MNDKTRRIAVVMAGGSGERFWPLSRQRRPKQLLYLTSQTESMLAEAVSRIRPLIPAEDVYVATGEHLVDAIRAAGVGVPDENVIAEPCKRNTSGCLAYAAAHVLAKYGQGVSPDSPELQQSLTMAVLTADHTIGDADAFRQTVAAAMDAAEREHALSVIGVNPTRPETGYGYVQASEDFVPLPGFEEPTPVYHVTAFHEKPDLERARQFVDSGRYFWNAGMFFWNIATFMDELAHARPALTDAVLAMARAMQAGDDTAVRAIFEKLDNISIDYALMEPARKVLMARAEFAWDDVGAWPALERTHARDDAGNILLGEPVALDCKDCIVYHEHGAGKDMAVAVVGAENMIVVVTDDAVLVMPKDRAQDVRKAVEELKRRGGSQI